MFDNFNFEIAKIFKKAENEMQELKHPYVGSEHLLLAILSNNDKLTKILNNNNLNYKIFKNELINIVGTGSKKSEFSLYTPLLKRVIDNALEDAKENNKGIVTTTHLFLSLLEEAEGIAIRIMMSLNINLDQLYKELKNSSIKHINKLVIYEIGQNLNKSVNLDEKVVAREKELDLIIETLLRKNKNNPLLVGKAGTGKTAIIEELARRIEKKQVTDELINKKIIMLEMSSLVAGTKYRGEFEERLNKIIEEVVNEKDIILFIDEIHTLVNAGGAEGAIDASNILKPYLARGQIKCIGATTTEEYEKYIAKDKALERRFQKILISEPTDEETEIILKAIKKEYEKHHNIKISNKNIKDIIYFANKYIYNKNNPDKCIDVLDSVCAKVKLHNLNNNECNNLKKKLQEVLNKKKNSVINNDYTKALKYKTEENRISKEIDNLNNTYSLQIQKKDILEVIENKTNIPLLENKTELYNNVKKCLINNIIGQDEAINKILLNYKNYLNNKSVIKPLSLLLVGPTGVGKTFTVKTFAKALNINFIRLDMSEYNLDTSVNKLIGVSAGYVGYNDDYVFKQVKLNPYSIILLDEIEKANPKVINLFLQILDEGFITLSNNEKVMFNKSIIFMTSNENISSTVGFSKITLNNPYLSKEIVNRIDEVITYNSIDKKSAIKYINKNIKDVDEEEILNKANYQRYGFRELDRAIKNIEINKII